MVKLHTEPVQNYNHFSLKTIDATSLPDSQTIARNNQRWIICSQEELKRLELETNSEIKCRRFASVTSLISSGALLTIAYLAYANAHLGLSAICYTGTALSFMGSLCCCCSNLPPRYCDESQNHSLDPSRTPRVLKAIKSIRNGETPDQFEGYVKELVQIKHFGILSESIYNEYITLINKKQRINTKHNIRVKNCAVTLTIRSDLWIDSETEKVQKKNIAAVYTAYEQKINEWNKKWEEFKPKLEADLPNPNLLQSTYRKDQILPV